MPTGQQASKNQTYGPYDPLDIELGSVEQNPPSEWSGGVGEPFPMREVAATKHADIKAEGRNKDRHGAASAYGTTPDTPRVT